MALYGDELSAMTAGLRSGAGTIPVDLMLRGYLAGGAPLSAASLTVDSNADVYIQTGKKYGLDGSTKSSYLVYDGTRIIMYVGGNAEAQWPN